MEVIRPTGALLLVALVTACGQAEDDGAASGTPGPTVRDSAGVRIVDNGAAPAIAWRVEAEPVFTVGWGPDEPQFTWPQSGRILPDGAALVGEFREGTIYRIGPDGSVMGTWGRKGEGPGEFQTIDAMLFRGDSILVSDARLQRITILSADGELRTTRPLPGAFLHQVSAVFDDGRLLLVPGEGYGGVAETRPEWVFETQPILAADPEASTVDTLVALPHLRRWYGTRGAGPGPVQVKGRAGGFLEGFVWARNDVREVRWYDDSGRLVQMARWDEEPVPLTAEWRRSMARPLEERLQSGGAAQSVVAAQLEELEKELDRHEGPLPYWNSFHVDRLGNVWLSEYPPPDQAPGHWRVVARDGTFVGWIDLPGVVAILDITDDRILAVRHDEMDVPAVVMFELVTP